MRSVQTGDIKDSGRELAGTRRLRSKLTSPIRPESDDDKEDTGNTPKLVFQRTVPDESETVATLNWIGPSRISFRGT